MAHAGSTGAARDSWAAGCLLVDFPAAVGVAMTANSYQYAPVVETTPSSSIGTSLVVGVYRSLYPRSIFVLTYCVSANIRISRLFVLRIRNRRLGKA